MDDFVSMGPLAAAARVRQVVGDAPAIVSVDMDVLEPGMSY